MTRASRRVDNVTASLPHQGSSGRMTVEDERSADDDREATVARDCGEPAHYEPAVVAYSGRVARAKGGTSSVCGCACGAAAICRRRAQPGQKVYLPNFREGIPISLGPLSSHFRMPMVFDNGFGLVIICRTECEKRSVWCEATGETLVIINSYCQRSRTSLR